MIRVGECSRNEARLQRCLDFLAVPGVIAPG